MSDLSFREMQLLAECSYSVETSRNDLRKIADIFLNAPYYEEAIKNAFVDERKLSYETAKKCECFYVPEDISVNDIPEELQAESLGFCRRGYVTYAGRLVYPVKDVRGNIMGFCGWDKFDKPKYLDSVNHGYKAKQGSMYGMEELYNYYNSNKKVFLSEGLVDVLYLRQNGHCALASLGSYIHGYLVILLRRFGSRLVVVPDCDESGEDYVKQAKRLLPQATVLQCKYGKDIDGLRKLDNGVYEQLLFEDIKRLEIAPIGLETFYVR